MSARPLFPLVAALLLTGCDAIYEALEIPNPNKMKAEAKAVGAACRHSGRSLEDCYYLHPDLEKAAIFEGWREMNEYMLAKELPTVPAQLAPNEPNLTPRPLTRSEPLMPSLAQPAGGSPEHGSPNTPSAATPAASAPVPSAAGSSAKGAPPAAPSPAAPASGAR